MKNINVIFFQIYTSSIMFLKELYIVGKNGAKMMKNGEKGMTALLHTKKKMLLLNLLKSILQYHIHFQDEDFRKLEFSAANNGDVDLKDFRLITVLLQILKENIKKMAHKRDNNYRRFQKSDQK